MRGSEGSEIPIPNSASFRLTASGVRKVIRRRTLSSEKIYRISRSKAKGTARPQYLSWRKRYAFAAKNSALAPYTHNNLARSVNAVIGFGFFFACIP
jgi:hypothetical protein